MRQGNGFMLSVCLYVCVCVCVCLSVGLSRKNTLFAVELLVHWASLIVVVME